ncbi:MAG: hypothetical protein ACK41U_01320 [Paracoccus sp. (in: a-proteobacteria)]|uniref:hypothetical protein n=1 Tax=Paracoccus sp. TaxID=267 RepID=UPI00391DD0CF
MAPTDDAPHPARHRAAQLLGMLLWAQNLQHFLWPVDGLRLVASLLLLPYIALTLYQARSLARRVAVVCSVVMVLALASGAPLSSVLDGLGFVLIFMAFLPTIGLVRGLFDILPGLTRVIDQIAVASAASRNQAILVVSHILGALMAVGAMAAAIPMYRGVHEPVLRREGGLLAVRGISLSFLWTPFTVGMGFAGAHFPQMPLWQPMLTGMGLSLLGLALTCLRMERGDLAQITSIARKVLLPVILPAAILVALNAMTGMNSLSLVCLVMPVLCVIALLALPAPAGLRAGRLRGLARVGRIESGALGGEILLLASSVSMGIVVSQNPAFVWGLAHLGLAGQSPPAVFAVLTVLVLLCSLLGFHATVTGAVVVAIHSGLGDQPGDLAIVTLLLFGWAGGAMLSASSMLTVLATSNFGLSLRQVVFGRNLHFMLLLGAIMVGLYCAFYASGLA